MYMDDSTRPEPTGSASSASRCRKKERLATGRGGHIHTTAEQAMLNLRTTYAIERAVATGEAVRLD